MSAEKLSPKIKCKKCNTVFICGANAGDKTCWCCDLPNVMPLSDDTKSADDCYCKNCLEEMIEIRTKKR